MGLPAALLGPLVLRLGRWLLPLYWQKILPTREVQIRPCWGGYCLIGCHGLQYVDWMVFLGGTPEVIREVVSVEIVGPAVDC